ncbi:hypothetical protein KY319_05340 [Candidatus Woesearchaeota archaeon]|nr:hypothetical protein [Candidatus Woesearchaeota archaeon]
MSLERAYLSCKTCSRVVDPDLEIHKYRNLTMEALEEERKYMGVNHVSHRLNERDISNRALQICFQCDHKSPGVVKYLEEKMPEVFGAKNEKQST